MEIEIFSLCDFAQDYGGKLSIIGTFDTIGAPSFPHLHPACSIAARIRFDRAEAGKHTLELFIVDQDGRQLVPPLKGDLDVAMPPAADFACINFCITLSQLRFEKEGRYSVDLVMDNERRRSLPVFVRRRP